MSKRQADESQSNSDLHLGETFMGHMDKSHVMTEEANSVHTGQPVEQCDVKKLYQYLSVPIQDRNDTDYASSIHEEHPVRSNSDTQMLHEKVVKTKDINRNSNSFHQVKQVEYVGTQMLNEQPVVKHEDMNPTSLHEVKPMRYVEQQLLHDEQPVTQG